ncbi:hypothetical protein MMC07_005248 [Pseudocyphellaria aurata]|nr:hypothetical protein [Pseudocyphellaria aurata]
MDHRSLGTALSLFITHPSSPGSPLFLPEGTHIVQKLQDFLRAQYLMFGIQEVITPVIYKESLWARSGHWENYKDDMFTVTGRGAEGSKDPKLEIGEDEQYGLKPMNCPGHCLMFQSQKRSYRDLPIRYADFSPLHRNEISGSLSGLTRLRRFHQDDGHIFCRPGQVEQEIKATLDFVKMVYRVFDLGSYRLVLSTRPETGFIGKEEEWNRAEEQLKEALKSSKVNFETNEGDGAFYGPKIDIVLTDSNGKEHQTATIQLDFQLPQRFGLQYHSPAPEHETQGISTTDAKLMSQVGMVTPVIIHRAILGSLERFLALLIERYQGHWPFWLSPRQLIILTVGDDPQVNKHAMETARKLATPHFLQHIPRNLESRSFAVHTDFSDRSIAKKLLDARKKRYNLICIIGKKNVECRTLDLSFYGQSNSTESWKAIEEVQPGSSGPVQELAKNNHRNAPNVRMTRAKCSELMSYLCEKWL